MVLLEPRSPHAVAPLSMSKGGDGAHASPARSSSRGWVEHPREKSAPEAPLTREVPESGSGAEVQEAQELPASQAMVTTTPLPPPSAMLLAPGSSASPDVLERALSKMVRLREDLQSAEPLLAAGHLGLVPGWLHSDVSVRAALSQVEATSEGEK